MEFGDLALDAGFQIHLAQIKLSEKRGAYKADSELTPGEFSVLWVIGLNPDSKQGSIANSLHIKAAHMTKLVDRLVNADLVYRHFPDDDRRSVRLRLSKTGKSKLKKHKGFYIKPEISEHMNLNKTEYKELVRLLQKLNAIG